MNWTNIGLRLAEAAVAGVAGFLAVYGATQNTEAATSAAVAAFTAKLTPAQIATPR